MFHVELKQFPNVARTFNLTREELQDRILGPWVAGGRLELEERHWSPEKAKLTIYEGPELRSDQIGLGRGWANVTRSGRDVTAALLDAARNAATIPLDEATDWLKAELVKRIASAPFPLPEVLGLAHERYPGWRVSDRLSAAERAVWELLHLGGVQMQRGAETVTAADWEGIVLEWLTWTGAARPEVVLVRSG